VCRAFASPAQARFDCGGSPVGIASHLSRERQAAEPPETLAGTLYMTPEQTGRMNRSIDSRSDLYALSVTFHQMLTGSLPFSAADLTQEFTFVLYSWVMRT
jgi:serine/threonine protein kinase